MQPVFTVFTLLKRVYPLFEWAFTVNIKTILQSWTDRWEFRSESQKNKNWVESWVVCFAVGGKMNWQL